MSAAKSLRDGTFASSPYNNTPVLMGVGGWVPDQPDYLNNWIEKKLKELQKQRKAPTRGLDRPCIAEFKKFIEASSEIYMGFNRLFENVPEKDPLGRPQVTDYTTMLDLFDKFITEPPEYNPSFLVFLPFTAILQWPMALASGLTILINPHVNDHFRKVFADWADFLGSKPSTKYITEGENGWLSKEALEQMPNFVETFECDPSEPNWGFKSWDHFFARRLRPGARPVILPENSDVITSACESKYLRINYDVQKRDKFWIKSQPYSLVHMLNDHPEAESFIGGTVYQAFLSPFYYHRWTSPVDGIIEKIDIVDGTYFAGVPSEELPPPDDFAWQGQQPFLVHVATRALIFIRSDNPKIGLMCFIGIGMVEVSTCEVTVQKGDKVKKGDEIGTFHFGGSSHCLVFGPSAKLEFVGSDKEVIQVNSPILALKN